MSARARSGRNTSAARIASVSGSGFPMNARRDSGVSTGLRCRISGCRAPLAVMTDSTSTSPSRTSDLTASAVSASRPDGPSESTAHASTPATPSFASRCSICRRLSFLRHSRLSLAVISAISRLASGSSPTRSRPRFTVSAGVARPSV